jgi:hypothetical protein
MKKKTEYPLIAVRVKPYQMKRIKREAERLGVSIPDYVRGVLVPFNVIRR